jgi:hypothetical protein
MLIGQDAPTLTGPLPGMQFSLGTISSLGHLSARISDYCQWCCRALLASPVTHETAFLCPATHLSLVTMSVLSTWHTTQFNTSA